MAAKPQTLWDRIDWFEPWEFNDDPQKAAPPLVLGMDALRSIVDLPIHIHVCWDEDGHSGSSYHYTGQAADFHIDPGLTPLEEFAAICSIPVFMGVGFYPFWNPRPGWHVDIRRAKHRIYWYKSRYKYHYGFQHISRTIGGLYHV